MYLFADAQDVTDEDEEEDDDDEVDVDAKWFRVGDEGKRANLVQWISEYCRSACYPSSCHLRFIFEIEFTCFALWLSAIIRYVSREKRTADEVIEEKREKKKRRKRRKLVVLVFRLQLCRRVVTTIRKNSLSSSFRTAAAAVDAAPFSPSAPLSLSLFSSFFLQSLCISISVCMCGIAANLNA